MIRFFHIRSRSCWALLGATSAVILSVSGPTATAQPVIPTLPESCVQLDENGVCVLPTGQPGASELPTPPTQTPTPVLSDVPAAAEPGSASSATFEVSMADELPTSDPVLDPASLPLSENEGKDAGDTSDGQPTPEADVPDTGRENGAEGGHGGPGGGHGGYPGGGDQDDNDDHDNGHGGPGGGWPGGGHGGHDDDEGDGGHHGGGGDHHDDDGYGGHGGGKPSGDYTEHNTHTETNTNVEVVVNIPVTIINDNSTYVDNSVTDNSTHVDNSVTDNSVTTIEKNTYISEVTDIDVQETHVRIGEYTYAERVVYLSEYDRYVRGCEYGGQFVVTAHYPQGVAKRDLPSSPYQRLDEFSEVKGGAGDMVAAPVPVGEVVTASAKDGLWLRLGVASLLVGVVGLGLLWRLRRRG